MENEMYNNKITNNKIYLSLIFLLMIFFYTEVAQAQNSDSLIQILNHSQSVEKINAAKGKLPECLTIKCEQSFTQNIVYSGSDLSLFNFIILILFNFQAFRHCQTFFGLKIVL